MKIINFESYADKIVQGYLFKIIPLVNRFQVYFYEKKFQKFGDINYLKHVSHSFTLSLTEFFVNKFVIS